MDAEAKLKILRRRRILAYAMAAFILLGAAALFIFRDAIGELLGATTLDASRGEAWVFETGYSQQFGAAGNGLAAASSTGLQLLGPDGYTLVREIFPLDSPALCATDKLAAAWDVGGTTLRVSDMAGKVTKLDSEDSLISVSATDGGMLAVCAEKTGYKGVVTVYDAELNPVYEWYSGEGYLMTARVSPDGKHMAALRVSGEGGGVHLFSLNSELEKGAYICPGELLVDMEWLSDGSLCVLSEERAVILDETAAVKGSYDFGGMYLAARSYGEGFAALALSKYLSGGADAIVTVSDEGAELGRLEPGGELKALSAEGKEVLCLFSDGLALYSRSMARQGNIKDATAVKTAVLRKNGDALAVYAASVRVHSF